MLQPAHFFRQFRQSLAQGDVMENLRSQIIGKGSTVDGPFGPKPLLYADYVASGRALRQIENLMVDEVLPYYANSHTEASYCGAMMTRLRHAARAEIARLCGANEEHAVIFAGSGATAGLNRLVHLLGVRQAVESGRGATVLIGPYEHHSNILPWRESGANVIEIDEARQGGPDLPALEAALRCAGGLVIGAFTAASNVTGITSDVPAITRMLKAAGAVAVWDYAGGGPYLPISMTPAADAPIDAIAISPHKFVGGPGASGLLIVRRDVATATIPTFPGGGTVSFVSPTHQDYSAELEEREEGGTPNVLGDIRAALAFIVKDVIGQAWIDARNILYSNGALEAFARMPRIQVLGNVDCPRLPIFSFLVRNRHDGYVNPQLATRLLSDYFGIQARGGCACAGPYGHRLLDIDKATSSYLRNEILAGRMLEKPGFVRLNFSYLLAEAEVTEITTAVQLLPGLADRYENSYQYESELGTYVQAAEFAEK